MLTVEELFEIIEDLVEDHPDMEVRLATQPNWPFEYSVEKAQVVEVEDKQDYRRPEGGVKEVLYLFEGHQIGYLPTDAANEAGWGRG